jgi:hypothetical protein
MDFFLEFITTDDYIQIRKWGKGGKRNDEGRQELPSEASRAY